jgi:hypothetical protein
MAWEKKRCIQHGLAEGEEPSLGKFVESNVFDPSSSTVRLTPRAFSG